VSTDSGAEGKTKTMAEVTLPTTVVLASKRAAPNKVLILRDETVEDRWTLPYAVTEGTDSLSSMDALHRILEKFRLRNSWEFRLWWSITDTSVGTRKPIYVWRVIGNLDLTAISSPYSWFDIRNLLVAEVESESLFMRGDDLLIAMFRLKQERGDVDPDWFNDFTELRLKLRQVFPAEELLQDLCRESD